MRQVYKCIHRKDKKNLLESDKDKKCQVAQKTDNPDSCLQGSLVLEEGLDPQTKPATSTLPEIVNEF
jgi:hypothetical protein